MNSLKDVYPFLSQIRKGPFGRSLSWLVLAGLTVVEDPTYPTWGVKWAPEKGKYVLVKGVLKGCEEFSWELFSHEVLHILRGHCAVKESLLEELGITHAEANALMDMEDNYWLLCNQHRLPWPMDMEAFEKRAKGYLPTHEWVRENGLTSDSSWLDYLKVLKKDGSIKGGKKGPSQGDPSQGQGDPSQGQGDQSQGQGDPSQGQGDQSQGQGQGDPSKGSKPQSPSSQGPFPAPWDRGGETPVARPDVEISPEGTAPVPKETFQDGEIPMWATHPHSTETPVEKKKGITRVPSLAKLAAVLLGILNQQGSYRRSFKNPKWRQINASIRFEETFGKKVFSSRWVTAKRELTLLVDISGSMSTETLRGVFPLVQGLFLYFSQIKAIFLNTKIVKEVVLTKNKKIPLTESDGGTDFQEPMEKWVKDKPFVSSVLVYTDGDIRPMDMSKFPHIEFTWLIVGERANKFSRPPWMVGEVIILDEK